MKSNRSFAKTPSDDKHEKPKSERMKRNRPSRFLRTSASLSWVRCKTRDALEARDVVCDAVEEEATDERHDHGHNVVERHEEGIAAFVSGTRSRRTGKGCTGRDS